MSSSNDEVSHEQKEADDRRKKEEEEKKKKEEEKPAETPAEKLLRVSRAYFIAGFFALPLLWFANAIMLFQYRNRIHIHPDIIWYRNWSAICFCIATSILILYIVLARTMLEDVVPWIIRPGVDKRQDGFFSLASLVSEL